MRACGCAGASEVEESGELWRAWSPARAGKSSASDRRGARGQEGRKMTW